MMRLSMKQYVIYANREYQKKNIDAIERQLEDNRSEIIEQKKNNSADIKEQRKIIIE